jgi:hypothetical protein
MKVTTQTQIALREVFKTSSGCVYQSDAENCFYVDFNNRNIKFTINCFFRLKAMVDKVNLEEMALNTAPGADVAVISPCACEHCYVLTLQEVLSFRELLQGAKVMLELNSIIRERLFRIPA